MPSLLSISDGFPSIQLLLHTSLLLKPDTPHWSLMFHPQWGYILFVLLVQTTELDLLHRSNCETQSLSAESMSHLWLSPRTMYWQTYALDVAKESVWICYYEARILCLSCTDLENYSSNLLPAWQVCLKYSVQSVQFGQAKHSTSVNLNKLWTPAFGALVLWFRYTDCI